MIRRHSGRSKLMLLPVTPSTAIAEGALVAWSGGRLIAAVAATPCSDIVGVNRRAIVATDPDFAIDRLIEVEVPTDQFSVWDCAVTGGLVATDRGLYQDLTNATTVNRAASVQDVVQCVRVISPTRGLFLLNIGPLSRSK